MTWMMLLRRPLGRLISLAFSACLAAILYFGFGKGVIDDVKNDTQRQGGGGYLEANRPFRGDCRLVAGGSERPPARLSRRVGPRAPPTCGSSPPSSDGRTPGAAFTAVTQLGTMTAVLIYLRGDLWAVARAWLGSLGRPELRGTPDARMGWYLIAGTVPVVIFGKLFENQIETGARDLYVIGTMLVLFGLVLFAADRAARLDRALPDLSTRDGVTIGLAQSLALIPGVSRSGAAITAGLLLGLDRAAAARFSFLLSVPAVVLSGLYELSKVVRGTESTDTGALSLVVATGLAFVFGYASIAFLLRYLATHDLSPFVVYRVVVGALVLALVARGAIA